MATWINPEFEDAGITDALDAVATVADTVSDVLNPIVPLLDTLAQVVETLEILLAPNIWTTMGSAALVQLQSLIDNLLATDGYMYVMLPQEWSAALRPHSFVDAITDLSDSLKDRNDPNRPIADINAPWAAITILGSSDNWTDFQRIIDLFAKLFNGAELSKWQRLLDYRFNVEKVARVPRAERPLQGIPRDWSRAGVATWFPGLANILEEARNSLSDLARNYGSIAKGIEDLGELLAERLAYYEEIIATLQSFIALVENWRSLVPELYILVDQGATGGVGAYTNSLAGSSNPPNGLLVGGITFLATGVNAIQNIRNLTKLWFINTERAGL